MRRSWRHTGSRGREDGQEEEPKHRSYLVEMMGVATTAGV